MRTFAIKVPSEFVSCGFFCGKLVWIDQTMVYLCGRAPKRRVRVNHSLAKKKIFFFKVIDSEYFYLKKFNMLLIAIVNKH